MKLIIEGSLTDLNTYINLERGNKFAAAKIKKDETERVIIECRLQHLEAILKPAYITFKWFVKDKKKDPDGIAFAKKFVLDGLVTAGVLYDDNQEWIKGFTDEFYIDKENPRLEVIIKQRK